MTPKTPSPISHTTEAAYRAAWKALDLLEDWLTTGYSGAHPELILETGAPVAQAPIAEAAIAQAAPSAEAPAARAQRAAALVALAAEVASCVKCGLSANRTIAVPGEGSPDPQVLFIGEGPGAEEDRTGRPFVGAAGKYLDTWLPPIGLTRAQCFIANCVKCRPPQNREPHQDETAACLPYLVLQITILKPRVICCLGRIAAQTLLGTTASLGQLRGTVHQLPQGIAKLLGRAVPVVVTYHPSAVLRDKASLRKPVWDDLKLLQSLLAP
jgi:uracil-DNA glycosylase family 4